MRKITLAAALLTAGTLGAHAADLIVDQAPMAPAPMAAPPGVYVQILAGASAGLDVDQHFDITSFDLIDPDQSLPTDLGYAIAGSVGVVVMDGVSVEADVFHQHRMISDEDAGFSTTSLMANLKYTAAVSDAIDLYVAAGLGFIRLDNDDEDGSSDTQAGFQLIGGAAVKLTDSMSLVGELRYQNTFSPFETDIGTADVPSAAALIGLKFGF